MKKLLCMALLMALLMAGARAEAIPFETSVELSDSAGQPVATLASLRLYAEGEKGICVDYALTNRIDLSLTRVTFAVQYFDADGNALREAPLEVTKGMAADPLMPGETREFTWRHWFDGSQTAASIELTPVLADTELDLPPWTEPQPNHLLVDFCNYSPITELFENLDSNPPVKLSIYRDEQAEVVVTDPDEMLAELESFRNMRVGEETDEMWTDSGSAYVFTLADGTEQTFSFNAPGIFHWHGHNYRVITE